MTYKIPYSPVGPDFIEIIHQRISQDKGGKIHFFDEKGKVDDATGRILKIVRTGEGEFVVTDSNEQVRMDQIITLFGLPGPAYDLYDSFANACLSCTDMGQFY